MTWQHLAFVVIAVGVAFVSVLVRAILTADPPQRARPAPAFQPPMRFHYWPSGFGHGRWEVDTPLEIHPAQATSNSVLVPENASRAELRRALVSLVWHFERQFEGCTREDIWRSYEGVALARRAHDTELARVLDRIDVEQPMERR